MHQMMRNYETIMTTYFLIILGVGFSFFGMRSKSKENVLDNNDSKEDANDIKKLSTVDKPIEQSRKYKNSENLANISTKSAQSRRKSSLEKLKKMKNEMFGKRHSTLKDDDEAAKDDEERVIGKDEKNSEEEDLDFELQKGGDTSESGLGTSVGDTTKGSSPTATYTVESSVTKETALFTKSGTDDHVPGLDTLKRSEPLYSKPIDRKSSASPTSGYRATSPNKLAFLNDSNPPASTSTPLRGMSTSGTPTRAMSPVNGRSR